MQIRRSALVWHISDIKQLPSSRTVLGADKTYSTCMAYNDIKHLPSSRAALDADKKYSTCMAY